MTMKLNPFTLGGLVLTFCLVSHAADTAFRPIPPAAIHSW